jgi:hypothetical protein
MKAKRGDRSAVPQPAWDPNRGHAICILLSPGTSSRFLNLRSFQRARDFTNSLNEQLPAGLSVRPCKVTIPTGRDFTGNFTDKALTVCRAVLNASTDRSIIARNGPLFSKAKYIESVEQTIVGAGGDKPSS